MRIRKGLSRRYRYFGYVAGPVFIYLNKGLDDLDVKFLAARILIHRDDALTPCLVADDLRNAVYGDTDP